MGILSVGGRDYLVIERSFYDVCFCANFGDDDFAGTETLITDTVSGTNLGSGAG